MAEKEGFEQPERLCYQSTSHAQESPEVFDFQGSPLIPHLTMCCCVLAGFIVVRVPIRVKMTQSKRDIFRKSEYSEFSYQHIMIIHLRD